MADSGNSSSGGIGFLGLLTIVFIVLKLTGIVAWSWLWVLAPLWIPFAIVLLGIGVWFFWMLWRVRRSKKQGEAAREKLRKEMGW